MKVEEVVREVELN